MNEHKISIILPCRNEEKAIGFCIAQIKKIVSEKNIIAEIIVSDSSTDESATIAESLGAYVVRHNKDGYGNAYLEAFTHAQGQYIFMADADGTYDFAEISSFIEELKKGFDFVIGNRMKGNIEKNAMPFLHRYFGNPVLSFLLRLFFKSRVVDVHCGMRAISREALDKLQLHATGMEFASEMVMQAAIKHLSIRQLPINYSKRIGVSKLKTFADGWRHLRFMLLYSPLFLFFVPGIALFLIGSIFLLLFYFNIIAIFGFQFQYHPMFFASMLVVIGYQLIIFGLFAKTYAMTHLQEADPVMDTVHKYVTIEKASFVGLAVVFLGLVIYLYIAWKWYANEFGSLNQVKNSIVALVFITIGIQTIFSSFMLSILGIKNK